MDGSITTYTGRTFWPTEPRIEDVHIEDIAHALSLQCRWTGHVIEHYSIAQHSVYVSNLLPKELKLTGLLHDASEAYLSDLAKPIKYVSALGEIYRKLEHRLEEVIAKKYNLIYPYPPEVKQADNRLLVTERRDLMAGDFEEDVTEKPLEVIIYPWNMKDAEAIFLIDFKTYGGIQ